MDENRFMKVQPITKRQISNKNNDKTSDVKEKDFQEVFKEIEDYENKNKETNTGFKGTKNTQMSSVFTPLKLQYKIEDSHSYSNTKSTSLRKLNFIA